MGLEPDHRYGVIERIGHCLLGPPAEVGLLDPFDLDGASSG